MKKIIWVSNFFLSLITTLLMAVMLCFYGALFFIVHTHGIPALPSEGTRGDMLLFDKMQELEVMESEARRMRVPKLCEIICNQPKDISEGFTTFYQQEKNKAFDDPAFRLHMERLRFFTALLPPDTRQAVRELAKNKMTDLTVKEELLLSWKLELQLTPEIYKLAARAKKLVAMNEVWDSLSELQKKCDRKNVAITKLKCEELAALGTLLE